MYAPRQEGYPAKKEESSNDDDSNGGGHALGEGEREEVELDADTLEKTLE